MKILVLSDSHGNDSALRRVVALENPDLILHLGDNDRDCRIIQIEFSDIPFRSVRGNCDPSSRGLDIDEFVLEDKRFFMTHGHLYGVKMGKGRIISAAKERGVDALLFGHTHVQYYSTDEGFVVLNPGSVGDNKGSYAIIELSSGELICELRQMG
ncbi:MAG: metallophosphoesterase [Oscillospiraceae bacterium]|nr:metallophosphoesterase [Oscillospiraceae bacterium]